MRVRVLIAEDHPLLRLGMRTVVESIHGYGVVEEAVTGREAVQKTLIHKPDLLLLDLSLPDMVGPDIVRQLRRKLPLQRIIALSDVRGDIHASEALREGCQGYLLKDSPIDELTLAIKTVQRGQRFISQNLTDSLVSDLLEVPSQRPGRLAWNSLTSRERSVLKLIAQGKTNRIAAEHLKLSPKTIEKHRASLMRKLNLRGAVELMLFAVDLGIIERPAVTPGMRMRASGGDAGGTPR